MGRVLLGGGVRWVLKAEGHIQWQFLLIIYLYYIIKRREPRVFKENLIFMG
jgi:hypothetical protein